MNDVLVTLVGNVGGPVDWRQANVEGGRAIINVACTPRIKRNGEWKDGRTTWYRVTAWRRLAENIRDSIGKGDPVIVHGKLTTQAWTNQNGEPREDFEVDALWVALDLRRGHSTFIRNQPRPVASEPPDDLDDDVESYRVDADGVVLDDADLREAPASAELKEAISRA